jgi:hypothetical protein
MDFKGVLAAMFFLMVLGIFVGIAWVVIADRKHHDGGGGKHENRKQDEH